MNARLGLNAYNNSQVYDEMDPNRLIQMLYAGCLKFLRLAKEGFHENDIPKRGENLGKAIAIISELNSSLDPEVKNESIEFLRGLYGAMLIELPKVAINNDIKVVDLAIKYIVRLKEIWETTVIGNQGKMNKNDQKNISINNGAIPLKEKIDPLSRIKNIYSESSPNEFKRRSFSA